MLPNVPLTILDGALGILSSEDGDVLALLGTASSGPFNAPAAFSRVEDIKARHTSGPLVEAAAIVVGLTGKAVVVCRSRTSTDASHTDLDDSAFDGAATATIDAATAADDDYEVAIEFIAGGSLGVAGITYQWSLDGGRTMSSTSKLGTGTSITVPTPAGLIKVNLAQDPASLVASVNNLRTKMLAHFAYTTGNVHLHADATSGTGIGAAATDEATAIVLANQLRAAYELHRVNVGAGLSQVHLAADSVNPITAPVATDGPSAAVLANDIRAKYVGHLASTVAHTIADATNGPTVAASTLATVVAGDSLSFTTRAAQWNETDLFDALEGLRMTAHNWNIAEVIGACDADAFGVMDTFLDALRAKNRFRHIIAHVRLPDLGETDSEYQDALAGVFDDVASTRINLCAGSCKQTSQVSGRSYRRPPSFIVAARTLEADAGQDLAEVRMGPLKGCRITDENGNPDDHDENATPGLDDQRFTTLRTFDGRPGVYITNGRMFCPAGSDYKYVQARRVMDIACTALVFELTNNLSSKIIVDKSTGKISKGAAAALNDGGTTAMGNVLYPKARAANCSYVVSMDDNILSTGIVTGEARVTPQGYVKSFPTTIAFENPALKAAA